MDSRKIRFKGEGDVWFEGLPIYCQMGDYRKKPIVVQAVRIPYEFEVQTLEGTMKGNPNDYLIRGVKGELYPCKPDVFSETYEEVERGEER